MLFNSLGFLVFFPIATILYVVFPKKIKNLWLLFASYYFYSCWNAKYTILLFTTTFVTFIFGIIIQVQNDKSFQNQKSTKIIKNLCLIFTLVFNFGILFFFKYYDWLFTFIECSLNAFNISFSFKKANVILPVGISFFTFQAVGYTIDVYKNQIKAEKNFLKFALFVSFFPQLVAGPIERSKNLLSQLEKTYTFDFDRAKKGFLIMLFGFFVKIAIADRAAILVNQVYGNFENYYGLEIIVATLCFALQIYCDFMGYSTIARGAALIIGIKLTDNFKQPYFALSIKDFWHRWHISLSLWLKDYVYIPLGGSRFGKMKKYFNLLTTFFISGLWHGASWNFGAWGLFHGFLQVIEDFFKNLGQKLCKILKIKTECFSFDFFMRIKTFIFVCFAWVFFRATSLKNALKIIKRMLHITNFDIFLNGKIYELGLNVFNFTVLIFATVVLFVISFLREKKLLTFEWFKSQNALFKVFACWILLTLIIFSLNLSGKEFIYFQF